MAETESADGDASATLLCSRSLEVVKVASTASTASADAPTVVKSVSEFESWVEVMKKRLPTASIPREKRMRQEIFRKLDTNNNRYLSLSEVQSGLPGLLESEEIRGKGEKAKYIVPLTDLKPAIKNAYNAARNIAPASPAGRKKRRSSKKKADRNSDMVDIREFHALLVAFRTYVQLDVVFQMLDHDSNRSLCWHEVKQPRSLKLLEDWGISAQRAKEKFPADEWKEFMKFEEFAEWCITIRFGSIELDLDVSCPDQTMKDAAGDGDLRPMLDAFAKWDLDGSGSIDKEELTAVLLKLDSSFTEKMAHKLFNAADLDKDGKVDYLEFVKWICG